METITSAKKPIKVWTDPATIEESALRQLINTANLPFVFKHVAVMPDVHFGIGATVGSVIATQGAVCPAAVGVDIGCGMMAVKTDLPPARVKEHLSKIRHAIERVIPLGPGGANKNQPAHVGEWTGWKELEELKKFAIVDSSTEKKAWSQMGSLGSGNHFIEVCLDEDSAVWVMLHSGSRGTGNQLAQKFIRDAKKYLGTIRIQLIDPDLAYLEEGTEAYRLYMTTLHWCQTYAFENRREMMKRVLREVSYYANDKQPAERLLEINCHHNYAETEEHFGQNVLVTRKGAVRARKGDFGIIPGSMGARSYIVRGLGNPESFHSCSHGAGRTMSRTQAKRQFTLEDLKKQTEGVECRKDKDVLDEIPSAYKNIETVMHQQRDLVEVVAVLKQILCVKGT